MSVERLIAHCQRTLRDIANISVQIRTCAALAYRTSNQSNNRHFTLQVQEFCGRLEAIRTFSDTILQAITFDHLAVDERIITWLFSGEQQSCLDELKEIHDVIREDESVRPGIAFSRSAGSAKDRLTASMTLFDKHKNLFHFLLTHDVWDQERISRHPSGTWRDSQDTRPTCSGTSTSTTITEHDTEEEYHTAREYDSEGEPRDVVTTEQKKCARLLEEVIRWLDAFDCTTKHDNTLRLRQEGTCTWFSETDAYKKWRPGGYQSLWLKGKAGCGKSVFVASTIKYLESTLKDDETLVFFYCDFRAQRSMDPSELMRSLLSQLFRHMLRLVVDPGDLPNKIMQEKSEGTLSLDNLNKLCGLVWRAARCFDRLPIVVIDAVDECMDIDALSRALVELSDDVRLLVTSRPDQAIQHHFSLFPSLSLESLAKELAEDITLHIRRELDSRKRLRSADRKMKLEIGEALCRRADGRFRWVQCQLDALDRCATESDLRDALDNLPEGLEETYEKILETFDERKPEGEVVRRTLSWLVVASAPLRLAQVADGLSVDLLEPGSDGEMRSLVGKLSSLVSHCEGTDVLTLSHFSVKEYLTCRTTLPTYHIDSRCAHAEVVNMCMRYISVLLKQSPSRLKVAPLENFPMLSYVFPLGFNHLVHVEAGSMVVLEALETLGTDVRHYPSHWECICELREEELQWAYPPWPSSRHDFELYILIVYSSPTLLQSFLSVRHLKPRTRTNPLVYAADFRKTEHAIILLKHGADVDLRSSTIDDSYRPSPLELAIDRGDDILVGELLRSGCLVSSELLAAIVCLPWCNTRVLVKLMQTDAFATWVREIGDEKLLRRIFSSARPDSGDSRKTDEDHVALARRLCELGQDLSVDSPFGRELVERAVHAAHPSMLEFLLPQDRPAPSRLLLAAVTGDTPETASVVRFLLRKGVDIHVVSPSSGDSALHLAVMCPWEPRRVELVKLLVTAGCDPHRFNLLFETPFMMAVKRGYVAVMEAIFSYSSLLPLSTLHLLLGQRHLNFQTIRWLLRKRAFVHSRFQGQTIFHITIARFPQSQSLELVRMFIEAGGNPAACNTEGKSVLEVAIQREQTLVIEHLVSCNVPFPPDVLHTILSRQVFTLPVVQLFIRNGADVHFITVNGDTVLHLAVALRPELNCLEFIKVFIEAGCDPTACNSLGTSVLEAAIDRGYTSVVDHLLSCIVTFPPDILMRGIMLCRNLTVQMVQFLLCKGADVRTTTSDGSSLLHLAIAYWDGPKCLAFVKTLIEAGCDPADCNSLGTSVLEAAIDRGHMSVVDHLLSCNVPFPFSILLKVIPHQASTVQIVQSFIHRGADIRCTTSNGDTILHLIIAHRGKSDCLAFVKTVIGAGSDPSLCNPEGKSAWETAMKKGYIWVVEFLLSYEVPFPLDILPKILPYRGLTVQMVQSFLRKGADVHAITVFSGDTVLHRAITYWVESTCVEFIKIFIEAGCNPVACNDEGRSAWETAMKKGYTSVVDFLLSSNAPFPSDILSRLLRYRCFTAERVRLFLRNGANVHSTTSDGNSVLHLAIAHRPRSVCLSFIKIFVEAGCSPHARNLAGKQALEYAVERGYTSVVEFLRSCPGSLHPNDLQVPPSVVTESDREAPLVLARTLHSEQVIESFDANITHLDLHDDSSPSCKAA